MAEGSERRRLSGHEQTLLGNGASRRAGSPAGVTDVPSIEWRRLREPHKTMLDPVQGDVILTKLETAIVDTPEFQRLRTIRQLGFTNLVFPGATHTRFEHSIGTLTVATRMLDAIGRNPHPGAPPNDKAIVLARLAALLHDITHVPSGHTLEDELGLFPRHDEGNAYRHFLTPDKRIGRLIAAAADDALRAGVLAVLEAKSDEKIADLEFPYVADIVGNTVCADLIDYLARDAHFTGLPERFRERFFNYLFVAAEGTSDGRYRNRLAIRLFKWSTRQLRTDNLSDIVSLLRYRYRLSERVYFHHTKMKAGAMLGRALLDSGFVDDRDALYERGDEVLVAYLCEQDSGTAMYRIGVALRDRHLYSNVVEIGLIDLPEKDRKWSQDVLRGFRDVQRYRGWTEEIEDHFYLFRGDIVFYVPPDNMELKQADVLVAVTGDRDLRHLQEVGVELVERDVTQIQDQHRSLWKFHLFVHPDVDAVTSGQIAKYFREKCVHELGFTFRNQAPKYRDREEEAAPAGDDWSLDAAITRFLREQGHQLSEGERAGVRQEARTARRRAFPGAKAGAPPAYEQWRMVLEPLIRRVLVQAGDRGSA